ncbi:patched domain-containing protein 3 [Ctenocephalides felis]|uniref:patched domain-containing protein 3 n=1 Tax=Ctenocephalides felis TaxID=7515 RepID=UPI000E6E492E|nr:patched domain-containing protein 3 [Ctenocephalides felis]
MTCGVTFVDRLLNRSFYKLGLLVGNHPGYFIVVPILLTLLCCTGYQRVKYVIDPEYLFSPVRGEGKYERAIVESYFKVDYTNRFNVARITRPGRFGRVIVVPKDGDNLLRAEVWHELRLLDDLIQNATVQWPPAKGLGAGMDDDEEPHTFTYHDACARWQQQCFTNDILNLDHIIEDVESGALNLTFPVMFNPVTWDAHAFPVFFGGTEVDDEGLIRRVPSLQLVYFVAADTRRQDAKGAAWEEAFLDAVGQAEENGYFKHISVARFASRTLDHELEKNTRTVVPYFGSTFAIMALFSTITCMMGDQVRSKPWLGLLGNVSAVMATLAAFGMSMYLDIEFIGINLAAPFLMIGIGIDDTFVMLAAWRRTSPHLPVPERMAKTLSDAAVSITITSLTDTISFWIGVISPFPSVRIFCAYSGFAVCFTFLWHLTFFAGCMAISGHCEKKNLHAIMCFKVDTVSQAIAKKRSRLYLWFCAGGVDPADPHHPIDNKEHVLMAFMRDKVAAAINCGWVKAFILIAFAAYLAGAGYGLTRMREGLERRKLSRSDSYSVEFFDREDKYYREFPYRIQVIISGEHNYSDPWIQNEVETLTQRLENSSYITSPLYTESWLRSFLSYVERNNDYLNITMDEEEPFLEALKELWLFPANPFSLDVSFNKAGDRIQASRFLIQAVNISDTNHEKEMVKALRQICHESPLNASVFHPYFVFFDQFELVRPTSIQSMIIGAIIMMIISFVFIPNFLCSLWVAFSVVSIELGVAGYMSLWDVNLDSVSMINLIMCIGFSVDFTAHICYAYMSSKAEDPKERVRECLYSLGLPIVQGSFSTILGVLALVLAGSYIFLVFFKMVFLVIFFGAMHGLFLLPVLLSLFGPGSCTYKSDKSRDSHLDRYPPPYIIPNNSQLALAGSPYGGKTFLGSPYKLYGDDKDLGIGTSGEDTSESSSNKSQRREALEDENTRRRYEEGWRRSAHVTSQFQPVQVLDIYGHEAEKAWRRGRSFNEAKARKDSRRTSPYGERKLSYEERKLSYEERLPSREDWRQYGDDLSYGNSRRSSQEESTRKYSDEMNRYRRYSPPEGMYKQNPQKYSSQHSLYHSKMRYNPN